MVDFYDDHSLLIRAGRFSARSTPTGDEIMNPAGMSRVAKPVATKTYRLWLLKYARGRRERFLFQPALLFFLLTCLLRAAAC